MVDIGVHEFDQLRWLTGREVVAVHACGFRRFDLRSTAIPQLVELSVSSRAGAGAITWAAATAGETCRMSR